eukprot:458631-Rhodomonas_salina.1
MPAPVLTGRRHRLRSIMMPEDCYSSSFDHRLQSSRNGSECSSGSNSMSSHGSFGGSPRFFGAASPGSPMAGESFTAAKREVRSVDQSVGSLKDGEEGVTFFERWMLVGLIVLFLLTSIGILANNEPRDMRRSPRSIKH